MTHAQQQAFAAGDTGIPDFAFPAYEGAVYALLGREQLVLVVENGVAGWSDFIHAAPQPGTINPALVPGRTDEIEDSYWMRVLHPSGEIIAVIGGRLLSDVGTGLIDWLRKGRLWPEFHGRMHLVDRPGPRGRIAYTAGLWVRPGYRGTGLSWLLPRWNHVFAMQRWASDYSIGMVGLPLLEKGVAANYGAGECYAFGDVPYEADGGYVRGHLLVNSRSFLMERAWDDTCRVWEKRDQNMGHFAAHAPAIERNA